VRECLTNQYTDKGLESCIPLVFRPLSFGSAFLRLQYYLLLLLNAIVAIVGSIGGEVAVFLSVHWIFSLNYRYSKHVAILLVLIVICVELQLRLQTPISPWNRACSYDDEGAWRIATATANPANIIFLSGFQRYFWRLLFCGLVIHQRE
jgi:hypothetical protein